MLKLDTTTFLATQDNPGGPIVQVVDDDVETFGPTIQSDGRVSSGSAIAYLLAYGLLAGLIVFLFQI